MCLWFFVFYLNHTKYFFLFQDDQPSPNVKLTHMIFTSTFMDFPFCAPLTKICLHLKVFKCQLPTWGLPWFSLIVLRADGSLYPQTTPRLPDFKTVLHKRSLHSEQRLSWQTSRMNSTWGISIKTTNGFLCVSVWSLPFYIFISFLNNFILGSSKIKISEKFFTYSDGVL